MNTENYQIDRRAAGRHFDRAAARFDTGSFVHSLTSASLFERLEPMQLTPAHILDLGCGTGDSAFHLQKQYRKARVLAADVSAGMLAQAKSKRGWLSRVVPLQADALALPIADHSIDLVFSNLLLPWIGNPDDLFREANRVLRKDGLLLFSALGPDSLSAVREAFSSIGEPASVHAFPDMHDVGDGLVRAGLRDPVLDVNRISVTWPSLGKMRTDRALAGVHNARQDRRRGLLGRKAFDVAMASLPKNADGLYELDLELVFGHAWGSGQSGNAFRVDPGSIPIRRR